MHFFVAAIAFFFLAILTLAKLAEPKRRQPPFNHQRYDDL